ncbi:MAG: serine/threonine protein kinase [Myxococcota bacterium]|jgi:serine/threonine protein kinase
MTYLARELDDPKAARVAIKVLFAQRDSGPYLQRLATEAQILQSLHHPHILECVGFVQRRGRSPYLVTRFEPGGSLFDVIEEHGPLPISVAITIAQQVASALEAAHDRGVVHRDLKPQNLLLRRRYDRTSPHVVVADFGIAKLEGTFSEGLTQVGTFIGTPEFAAPEQFLGEQPVPQTDVFALGGVIAYMLTGSPPVAFAHRGDAGACLRDLRMALPIRLPGAPELDALLASLMAFDSGQRATATEASRALSSVSRAGLPGATPAPRPAQPTPGDLGTLIPAFADDLPEQAHDQPDEEPEHDAGDPPPVLEYDPFATTSGRIRLGNGEPTSWRPTAPEPRAKPVDSVLGEEFWGVSAPPLDTAAKSAAALPMSSDWEPEQPTSRPVEPQMDTLAMLRALACTPSNQRATYLEVLAQRPELAATVARARSGPEAIGAALCCAAGACDVSPNGLRAWLSAPDEDVRATGALAAGTTATAAALPALARLITDRSAMVRRLAAYGVARAATRLDRPDLVRSWLRPLRHDADADVRHAWSEITSAQ